MLSYNAYLAICRYTYFVLCIACIVIVENVLYLHITAIARNPAIPVKYDRQASRRLNKLYLTEDVRIQKIWLNYWDAELSRIKSYFLLHRQLAIYWLHIIICFSNQFWSHKSEYLVLVLKNYLLKFVRLIFWRENKSLVRLLLFDP